MPSQLTDLPNLAGDYPVTPDQIASFRQNGHVLLRGLCSAEEVAAYRTAISEAAYRYNPENRPLEERDTYGKAFLQVMNLWTHDETVRQFVHARRFAKVAAELMGEKGVRIYHDQALYKEPHGGPTPWHQDQYYWPLDTNNTVTMWMPLMDLDESMGIMTFATGSHKEGYLGKMHISDESASYFQDLVEQRGFPLAQAKSMKAGDCTFHYGWTLHCAPENKSDVTREVMTVIWHPDGVRIVEPDTIHRQNDIKTWLPGLKPGDIAASELNPVVYSQT